MRNDRPHEDPPDSSEPSAERQAYFVAAYAAQQVSAMPCYDVEIRTLGELQRNQGHNSNQEHAMLYCWGIKLLCVLLNFFGLPCQLQVVALQIGLAS